MRAALLASAILGSSLALVTSACAGGDDAEACFEVQVKRDDSVGVCGYSTTDIIDIAGNRDYSLQSVCFPLASCPSECPASDIIDGELVPDFEMEDPNFLIQDGIPLCREDDVAAMQCCYWGVLAGIAEGK